MSNSPNDRMSARERALRNLAEMTDAEDAAITRAAEADADNPPLTEAQLAGLQPSREAAPGFMAEVKRRRGQRGPGKALPKEAIKLRLSQEVLAHFRATGDGWQTRIDETLKKAIKG